MKFLNRGYSFSLWLIGFLCLSKLLIAEPIKLATAEYPPYYSQSYANHGFMTEIIRAAYAKSNYEVEVTFLPWGRAVEEVKIGNYDGIYTMWYRQDREVDFHFSDPFIPSINTLMRLKGKEQLQKKQLSVGVVRGYSLSNALKSDKYHIVTAKEDISNIRKLLAGRLDEIVIDKLQGFYLFEKYYPEHLDKVEWINPPLEIINQHIAFSKKAKNYQHKATIFNDGLKKIKASNELFDIINKHGYADLVVFDN